MYDSKYSRIGLKGDMLPKAKVKPFYALFLEMKDELGSARKVIKYMPRMSSSIEAELKEGSLSINNAKRILMAYNKLKPKS